MIRTLALLLAVILTGVSADAVPQRGAPALANALVRAEFGPRGLASLTALGHTLVFPLEDFSVTVDGREMESRNLATPRRTSGAGRVTYAWTSGQYRIDVTYELQPGWAFVSKQIAVSGPAGARFRVDAVRVFNGTIDEPIREVFVPKSQRPALGTGDYGGAMRLADQRGLLVLVQNPFLRFQHDLQAFTADYAPELEWAMENGPFLADRGLLVPYRLTGRVLPDRMIPEWRLEPPQPLAPGMDEAEIAAFRDAVKAFLLYKPERPLNLMVGWCVNDYQIDIARPEGREEYKRIIDRAAELGADHFLFAPSNSALSRREESKDDWSWEHTLWLGYGQKIRKGEWDPKSGALHPSVRELMDHARSKNVKLVAYVYPVVPFSQNAEWLVSPPNNPNRKYASLGVRSLQDWLIEQLVAFHENTGIGGYAFDHTFLGYEGTSRYAQWAGWRRVMEELRKRIPDIAIDGRQAYHLYGPWTWLAGSYPHPTYSDEQPESFVPFPDLKFDRVSADRQRYTAYRFRNYDFAPTEIVPGFANHQTSRADDTGRMPERRTEDRGVVLLPIRERDWDYLGWRYSLLSSIATAPWNNVLNMIPARDVEEFRHFSVSDRRWFRHWIEWTNTHKETLRHTRTIIGQPAIGKIDGTAAIVNNAGFIFLFNPNARRLDAAFALDESIGMTARTGSFILKELYPREGRTLGPWDARAGVSLPLDGGSAAVYELQAAPAGLREPLLFDVTGRATLAGSALQLTKVQGEVGTSSDARILLPPGATATSVSVNGRAFPAARIDGRMVTVPLRFAGAKFGRYEPIVEYNPASTGGRVTGRFTIPARVFDQLAERRKAWPIPWTSEDFRTTWLVPERLLLFVQIAEPNPAWEARLRIDGRTVELKKAYSAVRAAPRTFVGFYADLTTLAADREHTFELELPELKPGQLQGVYFENVEPEYTTEIRR
jgi:hypothetical protein